MRRRPSLECSSSARTSASAASTPLSVSPPSTPTFARVVRSAATHTTTTTATNAREVMAAELAAFAAELHRAARQAAHERRQLELELKSRQLELTRVEALHARGAVLGMRRTGARAVLGAEDVGQLLEAAATLAPNSALSSEPPSRQPAGWLSVEEMQKTVNAIAEDILYQERFDSVALTREAIDESVPETLLEARLTPSRRRSRRPSLEPLDAHHGATELLGAHHDATEGLADDGVPEGAAEVGELLLNLMASDGV